MNKPVAYAMFRDGEYYDAIHPDEQAKTVGEYDIPLYTHPVKEDEGKVCARCGAIAYDPVITQTLKELTDEEIWGIASEYFVGKSEFVYEFARAILRKAQEK